MKLYEIPRGSRIKVKTTKGDGKSKWVESFIIFHHLDGAYSYCTIEGTEDVCHLSASQELKLSEYGYYELV